MKEYVLSFEEKITQPWFTYFQNASKYSLLSTTISRLTR